MANRLNDLPQELLDHISQHLKHDAFTLRSLCLTSKRLAYVAQSHLYADVRAVPVREILRSRGSITFKSVEKFLKTLVIHNPALAKHVKCFVYSIYFPEAADSLDLLLRSLRLMTNVKSDDGVPANPFQGCTFQLTHFHCNFGISTEFISSQTALQSLHLEKSIEALPSDALPNLKTLRAWHWMGVVELLPGRPIRHLEFAGVLLSEPLSAVATQLKNITVLIFVFPFTLPSNSIEIMLSYLTQLRFLSVAGGSLFKREKLYLIPELILGLRNLRIFIYTIPPSFYYREISPGLVRRIVSVWFRNLPKFEAVYFQTHRRGDVAKNYDRWLVNDTGPTAVGHEEVFLQLWNL